MIVASPAFGNYDYIYGFAEPGSTVFVKVERVVKDADGNETIESTTYRSNKKEDKDRFAINENGAVRYFLFKLDYAERLRADDMTVSVWYTDVAGNKSKVEIVHVDPNFDGRTKAEVLGKNIYGVYTRTDEDDAERFAYHRFVLPVSVPASAEDGTPAEPTAITVPVLAYKGYQVGDMTVTVADGQANITLNVDEAYQYEGGVANVKVFSAEPTVDDLRAADQRGGIDLSRPIAIGEGTTTLWVYAQIDVEVPVRVLGERNEFMSLLSADDDPDGVWKAMAYRTVSGAAETEYKSAAKDLYSMYSSFQSAKD